MAEAAGKKQKSRRPRRRVCTFCIDKVEHIDYKDVAKLRKFITERGKILPGGSQATAQSTSAS